MPSKTSFRVLVAISFFVVSIVGLSCKKDSTNPVDPGPGGGGGGGGGGGSVSDSTRAVILDFLLEKVNELPGINQDADNQTILQYVRAMTVFSASGVRPSGVWARFNDGRVWVYANNLSGNDTTWSRESSLPVQVTSSRPGFEDLPSVNKMRIGNILGSAFDPSGIGMVAASDVASDVRSWLHEAGYVPNPTALEVDELKNVSGDGVFYLSAHGDTVPMLDGTYSLGLWTATKRTPANDLLFKPDLDAGRLWYFVAPHRKGVGLFARDTSEEHYAITHEFVRTYMSFASRSVVFINACLSGNEKFRDACIAKGADLYIGWSNYVHAQKSFKIARLFFDRALGGNEQAPVLSPPQKGYQIYDILPYMGATGRNFTQHDKYGRADLLSYPMLPQVSLLRPLIYSATPSESHLRMHGWFGNDPGSGLSSVTVGGVPVPITDWQTVSSMNCASVQREGDVVLTVRGIKSKPVPLSKLTGTVTYVMRGRGTLMRRFDLTLEFLVNLRTNRIQVDQTPSWEGPRPLFVLQTSGGTYEASGEYRNQQGDLIESWSGGGSISVGSGLDASGYVDPTGLVQPHIIVMPAAPYNNTGTLQMFGIDFGLGMLPAPLNFDFGITGNTLTGGSGSSTATLTYSNFIPHFAPTDQTVR